MEILLIFGILLTALVVGLQFWMHRDLKADGDASCLPR